MRILSFLALSSFILSVSVAQVNMHNDIIKDPAISRRCKALLQERSDKIIVQQKLTALIMRNQKMQNKTLDKQEVVLSKLEQLDVRLKNNLKLTKIRIVNMEENIVRKGCPGITL